MSVALELPAITISLPISERVLLKASLSTQNPKILIEHNSNGKQSNIRLTLTELARLIQTIQILFNLYAFRNRLSQRKKTLRAYHQACSTTPSGSGINNQACSRRFGRSRKLK